MVAPCVPNSTAGPGLAATDHHGAGTDGGGARDGGAPAPALHLAAETTRYLRRYADDHASRKAPILLSIHDGTKPATRGTLHLLSILRWMGSGVPQVSMTSEAVRRPN